jgi:hypothetical protein
MCSQSGHVLSAVRPGHRRHHRDPAEHDQAILQVRRTPPSVNQCIRVLAAVTWSDLGRFDHDDER